MLRRSRFTTAHAGTCAHTLLPLLVCAMTTVVHAQATLPYNWTDGDSSGLWSDPFNWDVGTPFSDPRTQLYFDINDGVNNVTNDIGQLQLSLLRFDAQAGPFNISGSPLEFLTNSTTQVGPELVQLSTSNINIAVNLILDNTLLVEGRGTGTGTVTLSGAISGAGGLSNASTLTILTDASNSYQGATTVNTGTVELGVNNGVPITSNLFITGGGVAATFNLNGFNQTIPSLTLGNGSATKNVTVTGAGTLTLNGNITFDGPTVDTMPTAYINSDLALSNTQHALNLTQGKSVGDYDVVFGGLISGSGGLNLNNNIRVALAQADNTFTGATNVTTGSLYLAAVNALSSSTPVTVGANGTLYSYIDQTQAGVLVGVYNQIIGSLAGAGRVVLGSANPAVIAGGAVLTTGSNNTSTTFSGTIADNGEGGSVVKAGTGTWTVSGANTYTGSTTINAGTLLLGADNALPTGNNTTPATDLILNGGTFDTGGKQQTVNNVTNAGGTVFVDGSGSVLTVNGTVTQSAGTTQVNGNLVLANSLQLSGGDLVGTGTITGSVNNSGGRLSPGKLPSGTLIGTLAVSGNYTQTSNGVMEIDLGGTQQGTTYDLLKVGGVASLAGDLDVKLVNGYAPPINQTFDFLTYGSLFGAFDSVIAEDPGYAYTVSFDDGVGELTVVPSSSVPETSTLLSMGLMLATAGLAWRRRTKRSL